jgi:type II pantothenate kinase
MIWNPIATRPEPANRSQVGTATLKRATNSPNVAIGVDWGATLAKLAVRTPEGGVEFRLLPTEDADTSRAALVAIGAARVGLTGGGATMLARALPGELVQVNEFAAWGAGAAALLAERDDVRVPRYLLVSVGTGTSILLVDGASVKRIGGTALGGGTLLGLAAGLLDLSDFDEIAALAQRGSRQSVDLLVSDIYPAGGIPLAGDLTAENISLVCTAQSAATQVQRIAFGGSTLRRNPAMAEMLGTFLRGHGRDPVFLPNGEFAGALGALHIASGNRSAMS